MITRPTIRQSPSLLADLSVVILLAAVFYGVVFVARRWEAPLQSQVVIDLSIRALPAYTLLSLLRGFLAYGLSLAVTLLFGYVATRSPWAERMMIPLLDVLQSIPVLGFLPGVVLALVALFPSTNAGLELACIIMICTGQVWNMAFSFYHSLRTVPAELREASMVYQFNWWQRFLRVELPAASVGLAWNSMMAMAGGWFFLMVCEAFTLGSSDFRLPGLGAYMSVAVARGDVTAIFSGLAAMVIMIVLVDTVIWRPVLVWTQKFRLTEGVAANGQGFTIFRRLKDSWLIQTAMARVAHPISEWLSSNATSGGEVSSVSLPATARLERWVRRCGTVLIWAGGVAMLWAAWRLVQIMSQVSTAQWVEVLTSTLWTFVRVTAAVVLGSLWTVPVGVWIGRSERWRSRLQPLVQVAASFPAPMLYPLIVVVFHRLGWSLSVGAVLLLLLGTQWYLLFNVIAGASAIPEELQEVSQAYHFTPRQRWRVVWWPAIFPYVVTGWVTAAGGAWNASIVAEYVSVGHEVFIAPGLGSLISVAASRGSYDLLGAAVLTMAVAVVLINRLFWKPLYRLAETRYAA